MTQLFLDREAMIRIDLPVSVDNLVSLVNDAYEAMCVFEMVDEYRNVEKSPRDHRVLAFEIRAGGLWYRIDINTIIAGFEAAMDPASDVDPEVRSIITEDLSKGITGEHLGTIGIYSLVCLATFGSWKIPKSN